MKKHLLAVFAVLLASMFLFYGYGCKKNNSSSNAFSNAISYFPDTSYKYPDLDTTPRDSKLPFTEDMDISSIPTLGEKVTTASSDSIHVPPVGDQRPLNSCTGWAVGYGMISAEYGVIKKISGPFGSDALFSPMYIWNLLNGGANKNIYLEDAVNLVPVEGCCKWEYMPGNNFDFTDAPSYTAISNAGNYGFKSVHRFKTVNISEIKAILHKKYPVVIGVRFDESFGRGYRFSSAFKEQPDGRLVWNRMVHEPIGGHALLLCGYDDAINAFKFLNSWGTGWGNDGYGWIDYDFLNSVIFPDNNGGMQIYWGDLQIPSDSYFGTQPQGTWKTFTAHAYTPYTLNLAVADLALNIELNATKQNVTNANFSCHAAVSGLPAGGIFHDNYSYENSQSSSVVGNTVTIHFQGTCFIGTIFADSIAGTFIDTAKYTDENSGYVTYPVMLSALVTLTKQ